MFLWLLVKVTFSHVLRVAFPFFEFPIHIIFHVPTLRVFLIYINSLYIKILTQENWKHMTTKKSLYVNVHSTIIHNSQKVATTQMSINWWLVNNKCYICTMEYFSAIKRNEVPIRATKWMDLENIIPSKRSQSPKATYCMIPLVWNVQNRQIHRDRK